MEIGVLEYPFAEEYLLKNSKSKPNFKSLEVLIVVRTTALQYFHNAKLIKMSEVDFFIESKSGKQKEILEFLHQFICTYPDVTEKIRYKIPFYYRKSWICYLNPLKKDGIELAFTRGDELSNEQGILLKKGRKQIRGIEIFDAKEINEEVLQEIFQEAFILDETVTYASKRKKTS